MNKVTHCRACGSKALTPAFVMDAPALGGLFKRKSDAQEYVLCDPSLHARACGLLQSSSVDVQQNPSPSARHSSNRDHLRALATETLEMLSGRDCSALDIGCNDGSLLSYYPRWVDRYGVDPSAHVEDVGKWAWSAREAFPSPELDAAFGEKKFDIITAASVLEYIEDPRHFLRSAKARLSSDGVIGLETLYAPMSLTRNSVELFQAGVTAVYSLSVLEWMIRSEGMKVVKGQLTSKDGGSIRLFLTHKENDEFDFDPWNERLAKIWDEENALAMRALQPYQSFDGRKEDIRTELGEMLKKAADRGETVHVLSADAYSEALLRFIGAPAKVVTAIVDTHGAREMETFGASAIPVISETEARAAEPDLIIAPARLRREMLERWREPIMLGAKMIFATPVPTVITAGCYASEYAKSLASSADTGGAETLRSILAAAGGLRLVADNKDHVKSA